MSRIFHIPQTILVALLFSFFACSNEKTGNNSGSSENTNDAVLMDGDQSTVVDDVSQKNVVQVAAGSADHTTLVAAVKAGELVNALTNAGPFTVFAPTNKAFEALPAGTVDDLLKPENKAKLQNILEYHVSVGVYNVDNLMNGQVIGQVNGGNVSIIFKDGKPTVNEANIIASVPASNGIIHVIDKVLLPAE